MSVCEHDKFCPGRGDAHDARLTEDERLALHLPRGKELSMQKTKRLLRTARRQERLERERKLTFLAPVFPDADE